MNKEEELVRRKDAIRGNLFIALDNELWEKEYGLYGAEIANNRLVDRILEAVNWGQRGITKVQFNRIYKAADRMNQHLQRLTLDAENLMTLLKAMGNEHFPNIPGEK